MTIKHLLAHKNIWLFLAVFWTGIILFLCLVSSDKLPSLNLKVEGTDKSIHFIFHFLFTFFWIVYAYTSTRKISKTKIAKIILSSLLFGVVIEILQEYFTTTRSGDIMDVVYNFFGALMSGISLYFILNKIKK